MSEELASAEDWDQIWHSMAEGMGKNPGRDFRNNLIVEQIETLRPNPNSIVDVGCGTGDLLVRLHESFPKASLTGVEVSEVGIEIAREKISYATILKLHVDGNSPSVVEDFGLTEVIVCSEVLEHLDEPVTTLDWIADTFSSGNLLIITVPGGPVSYLDKFIGHRRHYKSGEIKALFNELKYANVKVYRSGFPGMNIIRLGALVRGKRIVDDIKNANQLGLIPKIGLGLSTFLLKRSLRDSSFGWQLVVTAEII
jgi:2-polyprenyl-3-methyl-5-hydroxy-6-metoxy-1,4-benzoquinol methylase